MAHIIDGKLLSARVLEEVAREVEILKAERGVVPALAVILVGEDPASQVYVRNKAKRATEVGMLSIEYRFDANTSQDKLNKLILELNRDPTVHGILVQLPLPPHLSEDEVIAAIAPGKDVDGFHSQNVGALASGQPALVPCTPQGCMIMLQEVYEDLRGKSAVVVGRSNIVGKPMAALLLQANCTVTIVHSHTVEVEDICRRADIVVAAVGRAGLVKSAWIKPGATVIDVGINEVYEEGRRKLRGDVDFQNVEPIAGAITPVPGGVGPMTIACLLLNTLKVAKEKSTFAKLNGLASEAM